MLTKTSDLFVSIISTQKYHNYEIEKILFQIYFVIKEVNLYIKNSWQNIKN